MTHATVVTLSMLRLDSITTTDAAEAQTVSTLTKYQIMNLTASSSSGTGPDCSTAFHKSDDTQVQVACQANDVRIAVYLSWG
jgi:hypothetical protein